MLGYYMPLGRIVKQNKNWEGLCLPSFYTYLVEFMAYLGAGTDNAPGHLLKLSR
jgi:hypothetical protein